MKLQRIKCKQLIHAWDIIKSKSYIVACTGKKAHVFDQQMNLLQTIDGLDYTYSAKVSPDEKYLLLVSNEKKFYIVNLETWDKRRVAVKAPYNDNIEGRGCWSFDGKSVFILVMNGKTLNSTLRRYQVSDLNVYEDFLKEEYYLTEIMRLEKNNTYLMIGLNRKDEREYFIHFDGESHEKYPIEDSENMLIFGSDIDVESETVTLYSSGGCRRYSMNGNYIDEIRHPKPLQKRMYFSEVFDGIFDKDSREEHHVKNVSSKMGLENIQVDNQINKYKMSECGKYMYIASESGFYISDVETREVVVEIEEEYGVQNFITISPDMIALATWGGVKLYKMDESD